MHHGDVIFEFSGESGLKISVALLLSPETTWHNIFPPIILTPKLARDPDTFHGHKSIRLNIRDIDSGSYLGQTIPGYGMARGGGKGECKEGGRPEEKCCTCSITVLSGPPRRLNNGSSLSSLRELAIPLAFAECTSRDAQAVKRPV